MPIYDWAKEKEKILETLKNLDDLLVLVKVKDEFEALPIWLNYWQSIGFSPKSIVIFDNMSELEETHRLYNGLKEKFLIVKYEGNPDNIQRTNNNFKILHRFLVEQGKSFAIFDADKFLIDLNPDSGLSHSRIYENLKTLIYRY